jgi:hypothetical protein
MSDSKNDTEHKKFPELKRKDGVTNYGAWVVKAQQRLMTLDLWEVVGGTDTKPPIIPKLTRARVMKGKNAHGMDVEIHQPGNQVEVEAATIVAAPWIKKNNQALDLIMNAVPDEMLYLVKRVAYAADAWNALRSALQPANSIRAQAIKQRLVAYICEDTYDVATWLDDCLRQYDDLCNMDPQNMPDEEFARTILNNMPVSTQWRTFLSYLRQEYSKRPTHPSSIEVVNAIREENWAQHKDDPEAFSKVFAAKYHAERGRKRNIGATGTAETSTAKRRDDRPMCTVKDCERPRGHSSAECFSYGGGKQGQYAPWYRGPKDIHLPKVQRAPRRPRTTVFSAHVNDQTALTNTTAYLSTLTPLVNESDSEVNKALAEPTIWMTHLPAGTLDNDVDEQLVCATPITSNTIERSDNCYHDSAANRHIFWRKDAFMNYKDITPVKIHGFSKGLETTALGTGDVRLQTLHNGRIGDIILTKCIHVPGAHANLISQARLDKVGVLTQFENGRVTISKNGIPYITGELKNEMYRLDVRPHTTGDNDTASITFAAKFLARPSEDGPGFCTA